ncbi:MAG: hypothetical protein OXC69_03575, partial [Candidatus Tectomicrobia bacterium]|nr:hypothetical protein [Candidatus Tectomicrobia bacterium]
NSVSLLPAIQATGLLILTPVGLTPTEQTSLSWTHMELVHFRIVGDRQSQPQPIQPPLDAFRDVQIHRPVLVAELNDLSWMA